MRAAILRGTLVNVVGAAGKLLYLVFLLQITRMYGPSIVGTFLVALSIVELLSCLAVEGFDTGVVVLASRAVEGRREDAFYSILANAFVLAGSVSLVAALVVRPAVAQLGWYGDAVPKALATMALALPLIAFTNLTVAATRARMTMKYDALILGFVKPLALMATAIVLRPAVPDEEALARAYVWAHLVCAGAAMAVVLRAFSGRQLIEQIRRFRLIGGLMPFALATGLSSTLNSLTTSAPVIVLGLRGTPPATIAFFGTALMIASNMRQIRQLFSTAFAPAIARLHGAGRRQELRASYRAVTWWSLAATLPFVLLFGLFRIDVMLWFHPSYVADTAFVLILLLIPVLKCSLGGIVVSTTGHANWSLANNLVSGAITGAGAWYLVPAYGVTGAAAAAAGGVVVITIVELIEARHIIVSGPPRLSVA